MQLLDDNPTTDDKLEFTSMAEVIEEVLLGTTPPFTIGIFGEWGSGKTSLMKMIEKHLRDKKVKTVWFNAWKYDGKEVIWNALIQSIFYTMIRDEDLKKEESGKQLVERISEVASNLAIFAAKVGTRFVPGGIIKEVDVDELVNAIRPLSATEQQFSFFNEFEKTFDSLVEDYVGVDGRLVVFIDDLDRCLPENAIMVMEALKLYLDRANCVFIIGAEKAIIEEGIKQRYKENTRLSAKEYLEKIVQLPFVMRSAEPDNALSLLSAFEEVLDYRHDAAMRTLIISGTGANPRRLKRFINAFAVLLQDKESLTPEEKRSLAKVLLIQMSFPELYYELFRDMDLIAYLTDLANSYPETKGKIERLSNHQKELYSDIALVSFLQNTSEIRCEKKDIRDWLLFTKEQSLVSRRL